MSVIDTAHSPSGPKPSTLFLITLNGLLLCILVFWGANILGIIMGIFLVPMLILMSGIWQGIVLLIERRWLLHPIVRTIAFILPVIAIVVVGMAIPQKINQQHPAISFSGHYTAYVGTEQGYWAFRIENSQGKEVHLQHTQFIGTLNIYWLWDRKDRFWIYNSDDGSIHYCYKVKNGDWMWIQWIKNKSQNSLMPPPALLPEYAQVN